MRWYISTMVSNGARVGFLDMLRVVIEFFFQQLFFYNFYGIFLWRGEREVLKAYVGCFSETKVQFLVGSTVTKKCCSCLTKILDFYVLTQLYPQP